MNKQKTRLFVIIDPQSEHQLALVKAMLIARLGGCHIHAFMCVYAEIDEHNEATSRKDLKQRTLKQAKDRLEKYLEPCKQMNVTVSTEVIWNQNWHEAALHTIEKSDCDLVIKSSFHHSLLKRMFGKTSDYNLMRYSPAPILFTHQQQDWQSDRILACLDLESDDAHHRKLNHSIISNARALCGMLGMDLNIASVFLPAIIEGGKDAKQKEHQSRVKKLGETYQIEDSELHLREGSAVEVISEICADITPSIIVIGSIARTGISGKLIGNTAEKLLDIVEADILTVN